MQNEKDIQKQMNLAILKAMKTKSPQVKDRIRFFSGGKGMNTSSFVNQSSATGGSNTTVAKKAKRISKVQA